MGKLLFLLLLCVSFLFAAIDFNTATKEELMGIKGIGEKKAEAIIEYRKVNKIATPDDLLLIKGFGPGIVKKIKESQK